MAERILFLARPDKTPVFQEIPVEFEYYNGFAVSQKQKSVKSMHEKVRAMYPESSVLEISTKSASPTGFALSAFSLKYRIDNGDEFYLENIFQSSKKFSGGGPFRDLLKVPPQDAKKDNRLRESGPLECFDFQDRIWPLEPKSIFYDYIYISALLQNRRLSEEIMNYNAFTDIEFNHKKSFNCQARAAAIFVALSISNRLPIINTDRFKEAYSHAQKDSFEQLTLEGL